MKDYAKEILKIIFIIKLPSHIYTIIFVFFSLFFLVYCKHFKKGRIALTGCRILR